MKHISDSISPNFSPLQLPPRFQSPDFIRGYAEYADVIEAPIEAHEAVAISLISALLNKNEVSIEHGAIRVPFDTWMLLLSPSGFGRNTLIELARPILEQASVENLVMKMNWGSKQAFYQDIANSLGGLWIWPEISAVLKTLSDRNFAGVKEWLTDRYDSWEVPSTISYRVTGKASDTPPIQFSKAPRLNILAASSYDWFTTNLAHEDTTGGFVPRWLLIDLGDRYRLVSKPEKPDQNLLGPLATQVHEISKIKGAVSMARVENIYDQWYRDANSQFENQANAALAAPFFNRLRTHVLKLAAIYEVSQSGSLEVFPSAMDRAIQTAKATQSTIFRFLPSGFTSEGAAIDRILKRIEIGGSAGPLKSELTKAFQSVKKSDRDSRLSTSIESGEVVQFLRPTDGRTAIVLVHSKFASKHQQLFPDDKPA